MRHKYITRYDPENWEEFFDGLQDQGFVEEVYERTDYGDRDKRSQPGAILQVTMNGEKAISIVSNTCKRYKCGNRCSYFRVMFKLNAEGVEYIKGLIVEDRI